MVETHSFMRNDQRLIEAYNGALFFVYSKRLRLLAVHHPTGLTSFQVSTTEVPLINPTQQQYHLAVIAVKLIEVAKREAILYKTTTTTTTTNQSDYCQRLSYCIDLFSL